MPPRRRTSRHHPVPRYVAAALGIAALASAGWGVYRWATAGSSSQHGAAGGTSRRGEQQDQPGPVGPRHLPPPGYKRPSLSLSLPFDFAHSHAYTQALVGLVAALAPYFLVTLIQPCSQGPLPGREKAGLGDTLAQTQEALADVPWFDSRRVVEYSTLSGRQALAKALACDVHVEAVLAPASPPRRTDEPDEPRPVVVDGSASLGPDASSGSDSDSSDEGSADWRSNPDDTPDMSSILIIKHGTSLRQQREYISSLLQGNRVVCLLVLPHVGETALPAQLAQLPENHTYAQHKRALRRCARTHAKEIGTFRRTFLPNGQAESPDGKLVLLDCAPAYLRAAARRVENIDTCSATGSDTTSTGSEARDEEYDPVAVQQAQLEDHAIGWSEAQNGLLCLRARWK